VNNAIYNNKLAVHEGSHDGEALAAIKLCPHLANELRYNRSTFVQMKQLFSHHFLLER
jgi:hypothetical protein